ncbi:unnamed protein product [Rotaria magnacalcarata]
MSALFQNCCFGCLCYTIRNIVVLFDCTFGCFRYFLTDRIGFRRYQKYTGKYGTDVIMGTTEFGLFFTDSH